MMKIGDFKEVNKGVEMWGGIIEKVWLCKHKPTGHFQLLGLVRKNDGKCNGWCVLEDSVSLKDVRVAVSKY